MLYCEPVFLFIFLPVLLATYFIAPARARNNILTIASLIFYLVGEWRFLGWLLASVAVNYWIAIGIDNTRGSAWAKRLLVLGITSDLLLLIVFKYAGLLVRCTNKLLAFGAHSRTTSPGLTSSTWNKFLYIPQDFVQGGCLARCGRSAKKANGPNAVYPPLSATNCRSDCSIQ